MTVAHGLKQLREALAEARSLRNPVISPIPAAYWYDFLDRLEAGIAEIEQAREQARLRASEKEKPVKGKPDLSQFSFED
ncbi:MAG: hypothetical protein Q9M19_04900 [Mariprofundaceae bacterium]|nr:hypothetical protein [Mariprofundaceae bacterium]